MKITYRKFKTSDRKVVAELIQALAIEDPEGKPYTLEKIYRTFDELINHPDKGTILVILDHKEIIGYSILINFWSNEYGGNILDIDELYIKKEFRNKGIGTSFIKYLIENKFGDSVSLQLEVTPGNKRARKLYERLGFKLHKNSMFDLDL